MPLFNSDQCPRNFVPDGDNAVFDTLTHCRHYSAFPVDVEQWYYTQVSRKIKRTLNKKSEDLMQIRVKSAILSYKCGFCSYRHFGRHIYWQKLFLQINFLKNCLYSF